MAHYDIQTDMLCDYIQKLKTGDTVSLSGYIYTARDAAHKKIVEAIKNGDKLPFNLQGAAIYYAGPTPEAPGQIIGSCGPTTAGRMDIFSPLLISEGLTCMIGKGVRNESVHEAMKEHGCVYLAAVGGAGAIISECVKQLEVIAYDELGCESVKKLKIENFPAIVAMDVFGGNIYKQGVLDWQNKNN